jgi:VWFA-related protein
MRMVAAVGLGAVLVACAQELTLHSKSELVVAPASVADKRGARVEGLDAGDLILYDNNVAREIHVDDEFVPISLVLVVQSTATAQPILEKLRKEASLIEPILTGDRGEVAIVTFAGTPRVANVFTSDFAAIAKTLRNLDAKGGGGSVIDGVQTGVELLAKREPQHRRVMLLIGEKHDRSSAAKVEEVLVAAQRANVTIYGISFSPMLTPYTAKAMKFCDPPNEEKKCKHCDRTCGMCARQCYRDDGKAHEPPPRYEEQAQGLLGILVKAVSEAVRLSQTDVTEAFAKSSGGLTSSFLTKDGLEKTLERIGTDLHNQFLISFQPEEGAAAGFHSLRVEVKGRPELVVRTRDGYWKN